VNQFIEKIKKILEKLIEEEHHVICLMIEIRKALDYDNNSKYRLLRFYCDWVVHAEKDYITEDIRHILNIVYEEISRIKKDKASQAIAIMNFFSMQELRNEIKEFLKEYDLPNNLTKDEVSWSDFWILLAGILKDQPINNPTDDIELFSYSFSENDRVEGKIKFKNKTRKNNQNIKTYKFIVERVIEQ